MRRIRVLLDANVLVDAQIRDLFLRMAESDLIDVRWSEQILDETRRALVERLGIQPAASDRLLEIMQRAFPHAAVTRHERLLDNLDLPDPDDRHVLAAAIHGECDLLVTDNTRDFPEKVADNADLLVITTDDALVLIAEQQLEVIREIVSAQIAALRRPPLTVEAFIDRLAGRAPNAAMTIGSALGIARYQRILDEPATREAITARMRPSDDSSTRSVTTATRRSSPSWINNSPRSSRERTSRHRNGCTRYWPRRCTTCSPPTDGASRPRSDSTHPTWNWSSLSAAAVKPTSPLDHDPHQATCSTSAQPAATGH